MQASTRAGSAFFCTARCIKVTGSRKAQGFFQPVGGGRIFVGIGCGLGLGSQDVPALGGDLLRVLAEPGVQVAALQP